MCRRSDSWLQLSLYSTRQARQGKRSPTGTKEGGLEAAKLPQLTFAPNEALGSSHHARQHAAFVAKRTGPFFLSPRRVLLMTRIAVPAWHQHDRWEHTATEDPSKTEQRMPRAMEGGHAAEP